MSDEFPTLTLHAEGPAEFIRHPEADDADVTATHEATLSVTLPLDESASEAVVDVYREGARIDMGDLFDSLRCRMDASGGAYEPVDSSAWRVALEGRVDTWREVALELAKRRRGRGAHKSKVVTTACHVLDRLAEHADDRPRLALLDLLGQYEVDGFDFGDEVQHLSDVGDALGIVAEEGEVA